MKDEVWVRDEIQSPCVKICVIHPAARICTGCLRTLDEIAGWSRMTNDERRAIMDTLPSRETQIKTRRGGRAARLKARD
ncbi:DUF1289 domain-containing protein [Sagittula sp. S175]|uniref:DUF1289 domain-containing protein n=1 Tax=Sagittula sp. S175 TaxID=3415129 RepID=UPI003C7E49B5